MKCDGTDSAFSHTQTYYGWEYFTGITSAVSQKNLIIIIILNSFSPISYYVVVFWLSPESQQIKAIYPSTLRLMFAVLISVIFFSTMADSDLGATKGSDLIPP